MSTSRSEHLPIGYSANSDSPTTSSNSSTTPVDSTAAPSLRSTFGLAGGVNTPAKMTAGNARSGAGSPSHEMAGPTSSRPFSKRAREIQIQEGGGGGGGTSNSLSPWVAPPTSGNSTPLRENIPESPTDGFPDFQQLPTPESLPSVTARRSRARAGTVPSRFPADTGNGSLGTPSAAAAAAATASKSSKPPLGQLLPFKPPPGLESMDTSTNNNNSTLLSRLRAGSMPQRSPFNHIPGTSSPFGPSIFSSWNPTAGRERGMTLASIASIGSNVPSSPALSKEGGGDSDVHMRTLDYLGLAETPQQSHPAAQLATPYFNPVDFKSNRFRSYSVNNKDKYADEDDEEYGTYGETAYLAAKIEDQLAATNAAIHSHNLAVQAFANQASAATRPRARTAGILDIGNFMHSSYLDNVGNVGGMAPANPVVGAADMRLPTESEYDELPSAVAAMSLARSNSHNNGMLLNPDEQGLEGPTSALWLGSIPTSTTISTLQEMFKSYGHILSARVLTHKNCGFVNYDRVDSAVAAKANLNGKEIFPGAGSIRINFAKPPSASNTPGPDGVFPSPSPDPFVKSPDGHMQTPTAPSADKGLGLGGVGLGGGGGGGGVGTAGDGVGAGGGAGGGASAQSASATTTPTVLPLGEMSSDILDIVSQFGTADDDKARIEQSVQSAIQYGSFVDEIAPIREPSHTRIHDAPKLRDIRKRIDNQSLSQAEIESIADDMLPEISELSSDYLGNTVVQKLFEHCSDERRDSMLKEIAPHLAEIGVHKNGTWAAQKIIDVCRTPHQLSLIVEHLHPYTVPLFLDQYGNYVLQGCLKFGAPYNDFIFETMLGRMWEIAQGRYGARAMRACLESHHSTKNQQRMLAAAIALHSVQLATNANGALLLTWLLDTCTFPQRRTVLAPQLVPYLVHLCTHKVAYLTVLKVINQKAEAEARDTVLKAMFFTANDQVLEAILGDHACGATLIFKVLTTPFLDETIRGQVLDNVKNVLVRIKAQPSQGYKRLMDEVGLSTRNLGGGGSRGGGGGNGEHANGGNHANHGLNEPRSRSASRQAAAHNHNQAKNKGGHLYNNPLNPAAINSGGSNFVTSGYSPARNEAIESGMPSYAGYTSQAMLNANGPSPSSTNMTQFSPFSQQQQQQQQMGRGGLSSVETFFPPMQAGGFGYGGGPMPQMIDQYRAQGQQMAPFAPPGVAVMNGAEYGSMGGYEQHVQGGGRRGRR